MSWSRWFPICWVAIAASCLLVSPVSVAENRVPLTAKTPAKVEKITESHVRRIISAMKTAADNRNVAGVVRYLSPDAVISMTVRTPTGSQSLSFSREEYRRYYQQGSQSIQTSSSSYSNLKVKIAPNGKTATATFNIIEQATTNTQTLTTRTAETVNFAIVEGQVLITSITAISRLE